MTRRTLLTGLLKSFAAVPLLGFLRREESDMGIPISESVRDSVRLYRDTGQGYEITEYESNGQVYDVSSGYLIRCEDNAILHFPAIVEPGKKYIAVAENVGTGMAFKPTRAGTITNILGRL